jgi:thiamine-monophosphate kinase
MAVIETRPSEDMLIERYFAPLAGPGGLKLRDDAALISLPQGCELVTTVDMVVSGVHFFADDPADSIAEKALGVNLSDLAAKGADPIGFLLAIALPKDWTEEWLAAFSKGLRGAAQRGGCVLLGGDTTRASDSLVISITAFGSVPSGKMVPRTGAKPEDLIAVTGSIGDAALGLKIRAMPDADWIGELKDADYRFLLDRYLRPQPRNSLAKALRDHANAAMDVSDGLIGDLAKMLRASGVTGAIDIEKMPLSPAAQRAMAQDRFLMADAMTGGDDYEVLFTLPRERLKSMQKAARACNIPITVIGEVKQGLTPLSVTHKGESFLTHTGSYSHF